MMSTTRSAAVAAIAAALLTAGVGTASAAPAQPTTLGISTATTGISTAAQPINGVLKSGSAGVADQVVRLVGRVAGSTTFRTLRYGRTDKSGSVTFSVKPPKGRDVYELVYNGAHSATPAYAGSHSKTVTVTVSK